MAVFKLKSCLPGFLAALMLAAWLVPTPASAVELRILSFNFDGFFGKNATRSRIFYSELKRLKPDVINLQEITRPVFRRIYRVLKKRYRWCRYGYKLLTCSRTKARYSKVVRYRSGTWHDKKYYRRGFIYMRVRAGRRWFDIYNTHLTWKLEDYQVRKRQAAELYRYARKRSKSVNIILSGDFNSAVPNEQAGIIPYIKSWKINGKPLADTWQILNPDNPGFTWSSVNPRTHKYNEPDRRLDFIFFAPKNQVVMRSARLVFEKPYKKLGYLSDHFGVFATMLVY